jgi:hypothetical protein
VLLNIVAGHLGSVQTTTAALFVELWIVNALVICLELWVRAVPDGGSVSQWCIQFCMHACMHCT